MKIFNIISVLITEQASQSNKKYWVNKIGAVNNPLNVFEYLASNCVYNYSWFNILKQNYFKE